MRAKSTKGVLTLARAMVWCVASCIVAGGMAFADTTRIDDVEEVLLLIDSMQQAWSEVSDYVKEVEKTERLTDGSITKQTVLIKFRRPNQFYFRVLAGPKKGSELIYPKNDDELVAVAHAGGFKGGMSRFLIKTRVFRRLVPSEFSLEDPSIVSGQHQTVVDSGLGQTIDQVAANLRTAAQLGEGQMQLEQECNEEGNCQHRIDVELPATAGLMHEVEEGESLWSIAEQYECPMYVIWYNNPEMRKPDDIRPGQTLFVPRYYAARGHIWVSPKTRLLTKVEIYDAEDRLYERYVYRSLDTNVGLTDQDFDTANPDYKF